MSEETLRKLSGKEAKPFFMTERSPGYCHTNRVINIISHNTTGNYCRSIIGHRD